jgi:hypothetical protein
MAYIYNPEILEDSGFSIFGTRLLTIPDTDNCFIKIEDSGGLGEKTINTLSYNEFCRNTDLFFYSNELGFIARSKFAQNKSVIYQQSKSHKIIDIIGRKIERYAESEKITYNSPKIWFPAYVSESELDFIKQQIYGYKNGYKDFFESAIVQSSICASNFIPINISSQNLDFFITFPGIPPRKIELSKIKSKYSDGCLIIENTIPIGNRWINGFTIRSEFLAREKFLISIGLEHLNAAPNSNTENQNYGVTNSIILDGYINSEKIQKGKYFASINKSTLIIHDGNFNDPFSTIDLLSNDLCLDGTSEEFVISPNKGSIFTISSDSKDFIQSVINSSEFQLAANRSSRYGPYVARNDDNLVRIDKENESYLLTTNGADTAILDSNIDDRKLVIDGNTSKILIQNYSLQSTMPMLESVASVLNSLTIKKEVINNFERQIIKLLGLEGLYLTYCVYGGIAQVNLFMNEVLEIQHLDEIANSADKKNSFMNMVYTSIPFLINEFEKVLFYFPSFLTKIDTKLVTKIGIKNSIDLKKSENAYINSLRSNNTFVQHFSKIEGAFSRLTSVRRLKSRSDNLGKCAPLGLSAVLSLSNPMFLGSAIQQGISLYNQKSDSSANESEIADECFEICMREWDHIVRCLLPVLSAKFAHEVYPNRLALGKVLMETNKNADSKTLECLHSAVSDRIGRLISFLEFPCEISEKINRQKCVDFIFDLQKNPDGFDAIPI